MFGPFYYVNSIIWPCLNTAAFSVFPKIPKPVHSKQCHSRMLRREPSFYDTCTAMIGRAMQLARNSPPQSPVASPHFPKGRGKDPIEHHFYSRTSTLLHTGNTTPMRQSFLYESDPCHDPDKQKHWSIKDAWTTATRIGYMLIPGCVVDVSLALMYARTGWCPLPFTLYGQEVSQADNLIEIPEMFWMRPGSCPQNHVASLDDVLLNTIVCCYCQLCQEPKLYNTLFPPGYDTDHEENPVVPMNLFSEGADIEQPDAVVVNRNSPLNYYMQSRGRERLPVGNPSDISGVCEQPRVTHIPDTTNTMSLERARALFTPTIASKYSGWSEALNRAHASVVEATNRLTAAELDVVIDEIDHVYTVSTLKRARSDCIDLFSKQWVKDKKQCK